MSDLLDRIYGIPQGCAWFEIERNGHRRELAEMVDRQRA